MQNGFHVTNHYADLWLEDDILPANFLKQKFKKIRHSCPFISPWPSISRAHLMFQDAVLCKKEKDAGPSLRMSSEHFQIKTMMTGFTCGAATSIPSTLFVRNTFHSEISSMRTFVH